MEAVQRSGALGQRPHSQCPEERCHWRHHGERAGAPVKGSGAAFAEKSYGRRGAAGRRHGLRGSTGEGCSIAAGYQRKRGWGPWNARANLEALSTQMGSRERTATAACQ
jgi:hypothetical protein